MRERVEDLGRISEKAKILTENLAFERFSSFRPKDVVDYFFSLDRARQIQIIDSLAYELNDIHNELYDIYQIARWGDDEENG